MKNFDFNFIFCVIFVIFAAFILLCPIINLDSRLKDLETYHNIDKCPECGQFIQK